MSDFIPEGGGAPSTGELSRQLRDVLLRVTEVATKLETQFISTKTFELERRLLESADENNKQFAEGLNRRLTDLEKSSVSVDRVSSTEKRVDDLEDSNKWLMRLVIAFVITAVLTAILTQSDIQIG